MGKNNIMVNRDNFGDIYNALVSGLDFVSLNVVYEFAENVLNDLWFWFSRYLFDYNRNEVSINCVNQELRRIISKYRVKAEEAWQIQTARKVDAKYLQLWSDTANGIYSFALEYDYQPHTKEGYIYSAVLDRICSVLAWSYIKKKSTFISDIKVSTYEYTDNANGQKRILPCESRKNNYGSYYNLTSWQGMQELQEELTSAVKVRLFDIVLDYDNMTNRDVIKECYKICDKVYYSESHDFSSDPSKLPLEGLWKNSKPYLRGDVLKCYRKLIAFMLSYLTPIQTAIITAIYDNPEMNSKQLADILNIDLTPDLVRQHKQRAFKKVNAFKDIYDYVRYLSGKYKDENKYTIYLNYSHNSVNIYIKDINKGRYFGERRYVFDMDNNKIVLKKVIK